ncbi:MAG: site-specific integrase [Rhodanobacter thiooxydans]|nr:site-specific integrase [Rhodanobacter thiooxydans]
MTKLHDTSTGATVPPLGEQISTYGWRAIPGSFVTREGVPVDCTGDVWTFAITKDVLRCNFAKVANPRLRWSLMRRVIHCAETISSSAAVLLFNDVQMEVVSRVNEFELDETCPDDIFPVRLASLIKRAIRDAKSKKRLWALYRLIRWYVWCAASFPEMGFLISFAATLDGMVIPGNPKGEAVRDEDPDAGPLDLSLELPLIVRALQEDRSGKYRHVQERAAVALCIALGRNPANFIFLDEDDLNNLTQGIDGVDPCYQLAVPRIKKRQISPRQDFQIETVDASFAKHLVHLINANPGHPVKVLTDHGIVKSDVRPLFRRRQVNRKPVPTALAHRSIRPSTSFINTLLKSFVRRHNILSPLTMTPLVVCTRRFRYTLATSLVDQGVSRRELARILDHSDTQHVEVYFEMKSRIIRHLEAAQAKLFGTYLGYFKGWLINSPQEAETAGRSDKDLFFASASSASDRIEIGKCGEEKLCGLDPPFSCYLCPKFRPYVHADHGKVLTMLLSDRESRLEKYESVRLGIQIDDVIFAVGEVVALVEGMAHAEA